MCVQRILTAGATDKRIPVTTGFSCRKHAALAQNAARVMTRRERHTLRCYSFA
jgi:hypothetical protein